MGVSLHKYCHHPSKDRSSETFTRDIVKDTWRMTDGLRFNKDCFIELEFVEQDETIGVE
jgi:hypothetical protein